MAIVVEHVSKVFGRPPAAVLHDISFEVADREFTALTGRSGSGKSTLLYIVSTLDRPTSGRIVIDGRDVATLTTRELHRFRNQSLGFVFQFHHLLPELTALENVLMPAMKARRDALLKGHARALLAEFGLSDREHHLPGQLSGGEQQRVAIARALVMSPRYLFADEPTGNLDSANSEIVMAILRRVNRELGTTVVFVTHDPGFAAAAPRQLRLVDGVLA